MKSTTTTGRITVGTRRNTTDARCPDEIVSQQKTNNTIPQHATRDLSAHRRFRYEALQYTTTSKTEGPVGAGRYRSLLGRVAGPSDYSVEAMVCYARHAYGTSHHYGGERAMDGVVCLRRSREQKPVNGNSGKMRIPKGRIRPVPMQRRSLAGSIWRRTVGW